MPKHVKIDNKRNDILFKIYYNINTTDLFKILITTAKKLRWLNGKDFNINLF